MKSDWKNLPFDEVIEDTSGGSKKIPQSSYLESGCVPVIDQGRPLIAGFTDDRDSVCRSALPVIVFGDHTMCFKYVDFPFAMGADGVKVLRPKIEADVKYLYYYLRQIRLPDTGYDRHFKYLKRSQVILPPLAEQRRIAAILDAADALREKRRQIIAKYDTLLRAVFLEIFGDPVTNPREWRFVAMGEIFAVSPNFGTMIPPKESGEWLSLRVGNIQNWSLDLSDSKYVDLPKDCLERHSVQDGDLLMARAIASQEHLGKCVIVSPQDQKWAFDSHLMRLRFDQKLAAPDYVRHFLMSPGGRSLFLKNTRKSTVQYNINTKEIAALRLPLPPIALQEKFAKIVASVEQVKAKQIKLSSRLGDLFQTLQHRAFTGKLFTEKASAAHHDFSAD